MSHSILLSVHAVGAPLISHAVRRATRPGLTLPRSAGAGIAA